MKNTEHTASPHRILFLLLLIFIFSHIDRQLLSILLPLIKVEFTLTDTQLGFLAGSTFALFYAVFGLPAGWLADHYNRCTIILYSFAAWSVFTALFGLAQNFLHLIIARTSVAIGEAGSSPASHSIIADIYPKNRRSRPMAIYASGINIGILFAFLIGGILGQQLGWRHTFVLMGVVGIIGAVIISRYLSEPVRQHTRLRPEFPYNPHQGLTAKLRSFWWNKTLRYLLLGCTLANFVAISANAWIPSFLVRQHDFSLLQAGVFLSISIGVVGTLGTYWGGQITEKLAKTDKHLVLSIPVYFLIFSVPFYWIFLTSQNIPILLLAFQVPAFLALSHMGPSFSTVQDLSPSSSRAFNASVLIFSINLIGLGLGPLFSGFLSDQLHQFNGDDGLRHALLVVTSVNLIAAWFYWLAARHMEER